MAESGDLRAALDAHLRWAFTYASSDPEEARCLVADPSEDAHVAEWVVRRVRATSSAHAPAVKPPIDAPSASPTSPSGLEALLDAELLRGGRWAVSRPGDESDSIIAPLPYAQPGSPWEALERLYSNIPQYPRPGGKDLDHDQYRELFTRTAAAQSSHLSTLRGVFRDGASDNGELLAVFDYEKQTLQDVLKYNRHLLDGVDSPTEDGPDRELADLRMRFVIFQLRRVLAFLHERGIACGGFTPSDILLTESLWVKLGALPLVATARSGTREPPAASFNDKIADEMSYTPRYRCVDATTERSLTERWSAGDVTNFEYLMALNMAAGRRMMDGVFHPFLPWVADFSAPMSGWRDLTKSKFRLNKGDHQLDRTFESGPVPHHITESLSEITYYIYMARRTPMAVLRKIVRSNFQPKEYPSTLARMFAWTPDECIPEFFTDASALTSVHGCDVMDDLECPSWCRSPAEFVRAHRAMLESPQVSAQLHSWIDLNFGYALSGPEAVRQKNVPLHVQGTKSHFGKSSGFVQLFHSPHPRRRLRDAGDTLKDRTAFISSPSDPATGYDIGSRPVTPLSRQSSYHQNETKRQVARMLSKATQLVSESQPDGSFASSPSDGQDSARFNIVNSFTSNNTSIVGGGSSGGSSGGAGGGGSTSDSRGQMMMRNFKQRKKSKSRSKSMVFSGDTPLSPSVAASGRDPSGPRVGNNMSRLATVIPNFFHAEGAGGNSGGGGGGGATGASAATGAASAGDMPGLRLAVPEPSSSVMTGAGTVMSTSPISVSPNSSSGGDPPSRLLITTPRALVPGNGGAGGTGGGTSHHTRHASLGGSSPFPNSGGSHLLRDLWQQLSKPDDDSINSGGDLVAELAGYAQGPDSEWQDLDSADLIDEMDMQLLQLGLPISIPTGNAFESLSTPSSGHKAKIIQLTSAYHSLDAAVDVKTPEMPLDEFRPQVTSAEAIIEAAYSLPPALLEEHFPDIQMMSDLDRARSADYFALGCIIAEIYSRVPLFSQRSITEYLLAYVDYTAPSSPKCGSTGDEWIADVTVSILGIQPTESRSSSASETLPWDASVRQRLSKLPQNIKHVVLALIHPHPRERMMLLGVLDGQEVTSLLYAFRRPSTSPHTLYDAVDIPVPKSLGYMLGDFAPSRSSIFPPAFNVIDRYLAQLHQSHEWKDQFTTTRQFLSTFPSHQSQLALVHWRMLEPVFARFYAPPSHTDTICVERVVAAIVFLLPTLARSSLQCPHELLHDVLRVYESSDLGFVLKICLSAPETLQTLIDTFGSASFLEHFLPVVIEWLASVAPSAPDTSSTRDATQSSAPPSRAQPLFATEACSLAAVACGELAAPKFLGPSLATKYVLPLLLQQLGKVKAKWSKLASSSTLRRKDVAAMAAASGAAVGMHMTFLSKASLYEAHHVADAVLQLCREIGDYPVANVLLPHLFDVLPKLMQVSEAIAAVRIEGVPDELGREIYVVLRVLRHVVRTLGESAVSASASAAMAATLQREFFRRRPTSLVDLLAQTQPPFLHPRLASAISTAAKSNSTSSDAAGGGGSGNAAHATAASNKKKVLRHLNELKEAGKRQDLRAFTAVGLARTIVAVCQRLGADATLAEPAMLEAINAFLSKCADMYVELEVSNFQWHVASELVSEFCVPLRSLLGRELFDKHLPVVSNSSVLQLLLLPLGDAGAGVATPSRAGTRASRTFLSAPDARVTRTRRVLSPPSSSSSRDDRFVGVASTSSTHAAMQTPSTTTNAEFDELLRFAYRSVRLHGVRATSFLHMPMLTQYQEDVSDALFVRQEEKRQRRAAASSSSNVRNSTSEYAWLRPVISRPFRPKADVGDGGGLSADLRAPPVSQSSASRSGHPGASWALYGEVRDALRAHSSGVRALNVDAGERLVVSGSKSGSCRAWRLSAHPCASVAAVYADGPVTSVASFDECRRALAADATCVHVWDVRASQVTAKLPFKTPGEPVAALAVLEAASMDAEFAIATPRRVVGVDTRCAAAQVVAEWRVDAHLASSTSPPISTVTTVKDAASNRSFLAIGTGTGIVTIVDPRTGRQLGKWQALDSGGSAGGTSGGSSNSNSARIVKLVAISASQLLVVGSEREARVWRLRIGVGAKPLLRQTISGLPEGLVDAQVTVQPELHDSDDGAVLFVTSGSKLLTARLVRETPGPSDAPTATRLEQWQLVETAAIASAGSASVSASISTTMAPAGKLTKSKAVGRSVALLPLRQLVLVGTEDGCMRCVL